MELHLTPEQERKLSQLANCKGRQPNELAQEVISFYLERELRFIEAVRQGLASAERGDLLEHEEVLKPRRRALSVLDNFKPKKIGRTL